MAWAHFTTNFVAGDIITRAARNELYDALDERMRAGLQNPDLLNWLADTGVTSGADVRDSDIVTVRIESDYDGAPLGQRRLSELLAARNTLYVRDPGGLSPQLWKTIGSQWDSDVGALIGYTAQQWRDVSVPAVDIICAQNFNGSREGIRLLTDVAIQTNTNLFAPAEFSFYKSGLGPPGSFTQADFETAIANAQAATEANVTVTQPLSALILGRSVSSRWQVDMYRTGAEVPIPAINPYQAGYNVWGVVQTFGNIAVDPADSAIVGWNGANYSTPLLPGSSVKLTLESGETATGNIGVSLALDSYLSPAAATDYTVDTGASRDGDATVVWMAFRPTFTHP